MHRIVEGVNDHVRRPRMLRIAAEDRLRDRARAHVGGDIAHPLREAEERGGVQDLRLVVVGIVVRHALHDDGIQRIAARLGPGAIERFRCGEVVLLPGGGGGGSARGRVAGEPAQHRPCGIQVLLVPHLVRVGERLAPVCHGESRIDRLCAPERLGSLPVLEAVQQEDAAYKERLRLRAP